MADVKIPYTNRSAAQIKEYILTRLFGSRDSNGNFVPGAGLVPEMTDHSDNNLMVRIISLWAAVAEMLGFYINTSAREAFLQTCQRFRSGVLLARFYDYRVKCRTAASVSVTFTLNQTHSSAITIPAGTQVKTEDNILFFTTADLTIAAGQTRGSVVAVNAIRIDFEQLGIGTGLANQQFNLNAATAYNSVLIRVNGVNYTSVETFGYSVSNDRHFIETVNESAVPVVRFGDGYFGIIPATGATIEVSYAATNGSGGNVSAGLINTIVSTLTLPNGVTATCSNLLSASGGADIETLSELRKRIPLNNRTKLRAVTEQDYIDIAQLYPSVSKAGVETACGAAITLYIVPTGGGVASTQLLSDVLAYFADKKILGRTLVVQPAGEVKIKLSIQLKVRGDYSQTAVYEAVKTNLTTFLSYTNQAIKGRVELSDIYQIIETTEGVVASKIVVMTTVPFARPIGAWQTLDWSVATQAAYNATNTWRIEFITVSTFQLFKNEEYVGTFSVGALVSRTEVQFTINVNYAIGDKFQFTTYPYFGTVQLTEPSLPVAYAADITLSNY